MTRAVLQRGVAAATGKLNKGPKALHLTRLYNSSTFNAYHSTCSCCGTLFCTSAASIAVPTSIASLTKQKGLDSKNGFKNNNKSLFTAGRAFTTGLEDAGQRQIDKILGNNKVWVNKRLQEDHDYFKKLGQVQRPKILYIGCSDSRVPANEILGLGPGEVFVHRNIGNQVPGNDLNALSVIEYAVGHVGVTDIIVTGHYDCGAIRAATTRQDLGLLENWLRLIRDTYRLHKEHLDHIDDLEERHCRLVELNVTEQCLNIYKTGIVQRKRFETRDKLGAAEMYPRIHGLVFKPSDGILKQLPIEFDKRVGSLQHIYNLYSKPTE